MVGGAVSRLPAGSAVDGADSDLSRRDAIRVTLALWAMAVVFAGITLARSRHLGIALRDPHGQMFRHRLLSAVLLCVVLLLADAVVRGCWRAARRRRGDRSWVLLPREVAVALRERWTPRRIALVASGLLAYHVVYVCYRNLKSWDAFNTPRDHDLASVDRWLFFGHTPAVVVHDLLGRSTAMASVLAHVYDFFPQLISVAVVAAPAFVTRTRRGMVMLTAGLWAWILGAASYYAVPSLGPCFTAAADFAALPHTDITDHWAAYWQQRTDFLADPSAPTSFVSISAFASLHVGLTCMVVLMAAYYRKRVLAAVLAVYLAAVMVSTVYFGWHFFVDVLAGVVLAVLAVALGHLTVYPRTLLRRGRAAR